MRKYVGLYDCQVHMGCQEEICIIANSLEEAEKYIEDGYSSYMVSWEYTAMDTWRARIEEEQGEEPEDCEDFYESQECEDFWSDGYWTVREATEEDLKNYDEEYWIDIR